MGFPDAQQINTKTLTMKRTVDGLPLVEKVADGEKLLIVPAWAVIHHFASEALREDSPYFQWYTKLRVKIYRDGIRAVVRATVFDNAEAEVATAFTYCDISQGVNFLSSASTRTLAKALRFVGIGRLNDDDLVDLITDEDYEEMKNSQRQQDTGLDLQALENSVSQLVTPEIQAQFDNIINQLKDGKKGAVESDDVPQRDADSGD